MGAGEGLLTDPGMAGLRWVSAFAALSSRICINLPQRVGVKHRLIFEVFTFEVLLAQGDLGAAGLRLHVLFHRGDALLAAALNISQRVGVTLLVVSPNMTFRKLRVQ